MSVSRVALKKSTRVAWFFCALASLSLVSCSRGGKDSSNHDAGNAVHWGYESADGPELWGAMHPDWILCAEGLAQSPIDLANAAQSALPPVVIRTPSAQTVEVLNQKGVIDALDNGHTIQINSKTGESMSVGEKAYGLVQFHFHAPSEHTVNGQHYPMEMHFVHQADDGALAVVGVFVEAGAENPSIAPLWAQLAETSGTGAVIQMPSTFAEHVFTGEGTGVYHYTGSLTTPPCSEGVKWYVRKTPTQLSAAQIAAFTAVYDHNNRPIQALNERTLHFDKDPDLTVH